MVYSTTLPSFCITASNRRNDEWQIRKDDERLWPNIISATSRQWGDPRNQYLNTLFLTRCQTPWFKWQIHTLFNDFVTFTMEWNKETACVKDRSKSLGDEGSILNHEPQSSVWKDKIKHKRIDGDNRCLDSNWILQNTKQSRVENEAWSINTVTADEERRGWWKRLWLHLSESPYHVSIYAT